MVTSKDSEAKAKTEAGQKAPAKKPKKTLAAPKPAAIKKATNRTEARDIGVDVRAPQTTCTDQFCPFHGILPVRGIIIEGDVVTDGMQSTVVVKRKYMRKNQKYERLEKRSGRYMVHSPPCIGAAKGDHVKIMECRPLSKMVSFVVIEKTEKV